MTLFTVWLCSFPIYFPPTSVLFLQCLLTSLSLVSLSVLNLICKRRTLHIFYFRRVFKVFSSFSFCVCCRCNGDTMFSPLYLDRMLDELQRSISPQRKTAPPKVETAEAKDSLVYVASVHHTSSSKSVSTSGTANQQLAEQAVTQTSIARRLFDTSADSKENSSSARTRSKSPEPAHSIESYNVSVCSIQINLYQLKIYLKIGGTIWKGFVRKWQSFEFAAEGIPRISLVQQNSRRQFSSCRNAGNSHTRG